MNDYLYLIAELAAAFAGFTAIVSVLDSRSDSATRALDVLRLRAMLEASLCTIVLALLPTLLLQIGLEATTWRWACAIGTVTVAVLYTAQMRRGFAREMRETPGYSLVFARFLAGVGVVGLSCLVVGAFDVGAFGVGDPRALYLVCATLLLSVAGLQFFRVSISIMGSASG